MHGIALKRKNTHFGSAKIKRNPFSIHFFKESSFYASDLIQYFNTV